MANQKVLIFLLYLEEEKEKNVFQRIAWKWIFILCQWFNYLDAAAFIQIFIYHITITLELSYKMQKCGPSTLVFCLLQPASESSEVGSC